MKVSIKDIAARLGVSPAVVSLVINGKEKEARINKNTAQRIRDLAAELNYSPNQIAKGLKKGKSNIIGLIVADISNPFFARLTREIEDEAERFNYKIIIGSSDESAEKMASLTNIMKTYQVDGFILVPAENSEEQIKQLIENDYPAVLVDRYLPGIDSNCVLINNVQTANLGTNYLIKQGCRNIALFSYKSELQHFQERIKGFKDALKSSGLSFSKENIHFVRFENLYEDLKQGITKILKGSIMYDGIFFATDTLALNGIQILKNLDVDISSKFKILSFDENDTFEFLNFPIPHFAQPLKEMGKTAVNLLVNLIENENSSKTTKILLTPKWFEK